VDKLYRCIYKSGGVVNPSFMF